MAHDSAIEEPSLHPQGSAHDDDAAQFGTGVEHMSQRHVHRIEQRVLVEQILGGVRGQPELGEHGQDHVVLVRLPSKADCLVGIAHRIGRPHPRYAHCDPGEPVPVDRAKGQPASLARHGRALMTDLAFRERRHLHRSPLVRLGCRSLVNQVMGKLSGRRRGTARVHGHGSDAVPSGRWDLRLCPRAAHRATLSLAAYATSAWR